MTDLQAPAPPTAPADPPARPRRRRRLMTGLVVAGLAAATVTAGLVTGVVGPSRLVEGSSAGTALLVEPPASPGAEAESVDGAVVSEDGAFGPEDRVRVEDGRWLDLTVSLRNESPVPVRVTGISTPLSTSRGISVLDDVEVTVPVDEVGPDNSWRPFGDGLDLAPGADWRVRLVGRFDVECSSPFSMTMDGIQTNRLVDVSYEVLGVSRQVSPEVTRLVLEGPLRANC